MTEASLKTPIAKSPLQPVRVAMDDGADGLTRLPFSHISGIHITKKKFPATA